MDLEVQRGVVDAPQLNRATVRRMIRGAGRKSKAKQSHATKNDIRAILESKWQQQKQENQSSQDAEKQPN